MTSKQKESGRTKRDIDYVHGCRLKYPQHCSRSIESSNPFDPLSSMARPSWLVDGNRIATKIKSAAGAVDPGKINWKSNPSRACPNCQYTIDNNDVVQEWPGLPRGVKFDPSDPEIILHLQAKLGLGNLKIHPFIDEFIPTVDEDDGICYTHPRNLPGVKQDGSAAHFFHRSIKAYNTGTRKRRKIQGDDMVDVRWHKTGRTKPVFSDGVQKGCKKIMVLYMNKPGGGRPEKTNWVMHQYHLGTEEDEKDGEFVISKVFYQQQQGKSSERNLEDIPEFADDVSIKVDPITPKSVTPDPPHNERRACHELGKETIVPDMDFMAQDYEMGSPGIARQAEHELPGDDVQDRADNQIDHIVTVNQIDEIGAGIQIDHIGAVDQIDEIGAEIQIDHIGVVNQIDVTRAENQMDETIAENQIDHIFDNNGDEAGGDPKWWDSESQYLLDSQQLVEGLSLCDDLLCSPTPDRDGTEHDGERKPKPSLSDYALLGSEHLKKDLEECQNLVLDPPNLELDTPPDFRLSQLEFGSQESFLAWGIGKVGD